MIRKVATIPLKEGRLHKNRNVEWRLLGNIVDIVDSCSISLAEQVKA